MKKKFCMAVMLVAALTLTIDTSLASIIPPGEFGEIALDRSLPDITSFKEDPEMNYYYSGPEHGAMAIIGIRKEYRQVNDNWKSISGPKLREVVYDMVNYRPGDIFHTHSLKTKNGAFIGVWYSQLSMMFHTAPIHFKVHGQEVNMYTPAWNCSDGLCAMEQW